MSNNDGIQHNYAFVYSRGVFTIQDAPVSFQTIAYSINASGQVVGSYDNGSTNYHGFIASIAAVP